MKKKSDNTILLEVTNKIVHNFYKKLEAIINI